MISNKANRMVKKHIFGLNLAFLLIFFGITLFVNFLHNESHFQNHNSCPACHFQNSTLTTAQIHFCTLPQLSLLHSLGTYEAVTHLEIVSVAPSSRSPPQA
jgi:hypothetical protein